MIEQHMFFLQWASRLTMLTYNQHGRYHWGVGGPELPKIWTDPPTFYIAF